MSGRPSIASVSRCDPSRRARAAGIASSKKSQMCPPRPDREAGIDSSEGPLRAADRCAPAGADETGVSSASTATVPALSARLSRLTLANRP